MGNKKFMGLFVVGLLLIGGFVRASNVFGLSYSSDIGVSFTFNPTLKIVLSATGCGSTESEAKLCISNLSPGTASDSNILTVKILNNTGNGYTLNATVGSDTLEGGKFNTRNLVHSNSSITSSFASIDTTASLTNNTDLTDNTWGYSFMDETLSNPTWSSYSGLPLYSDTTPATLKTSLNPATSADGDILKFKIAAKSATMLPSGEYSNVINFTVTAQPLPVTLSMAYENAGKEKLNGYFKLQDMTADICNATDVLDEGSQMQAIDIRDNKVYWITKLQDGKCWMTQNLDHDISTTFAYTPDNTDITANWTPDKSTYATGTTTWTTGFTGYTIQQSYDPGNKIWNGMTNSSGLTLDTMTQGTNQHYHIGNYYNWGAAVAMNDTSSYITQTDINQSICPRGWMLPKSGNITTAGSFQYLVNKYNFAFSQMTNPNIWQAPLYFPLSGYWRGTSHSIASYGSFWSSVVYSSELAYRLLESYNGDVNPVDNVDRIGGRSIRCVSR